MLRSPRKRLVHAGIVLSALIWSAAPTQAQYIPLGTYAVGSSYNYDFGAFLKPYLSALNTSDSLVTFSFKFSSSGALPPGLTLTPDGLLSGIFTTPGQYQFIVDLSYTFTYAASLDIPPIDVGPFTFEPLSVIVGNSTGSKVSVLPGGLSFNLTSGAGPSQQSLTVSNTTATPVAFAASPSGGSWLSASGGGVAAAFAQGSVVVTANPSGLSPGTYSGKVTISGSFAGSPISVPVILTITGAAQVLRLSQSGLFFAVSQGGPSPPPQAFAVPNAGTGTLSFSAEATTQTGGSWLSISPAAGNSSATAAVLVTVSVNPAGLTAGTYYGQVLVSSSGVSNSPRS